MPEALKKKMFGLPRWAWILILVAAIGIGLYLRHQRESEEETEETPAEGAPQGSYPLQESEGGYVLAGEGAGYGSGYYEGVPAESGELAETAPVTIEINYPETAPSAVGADNSENFVGGEPIEEPAANVTTKTHAPSHASGGGTATGGGPPAKPSASSKAAGVKNVTPTGGGGVKAVSTKTGKTIAIGAVRAVGGGGGGGGGGGNGGGGGGGAATNNQGGAPQNNQQHPAAVNTGNKCVNGGVGGHSAPSGYHLFCQGGWIWRAPNS